MAAVVELLLLPRARLPQPLLLLLLPSPSPPRRPRQLLAHWPPWPCLHRLRPQLHPPPMEMAVDTCERATRCNC